jgi:hypothetical protein
MTQVNILAFTAGYRERRNDPVPDMELGIKCGTVVINTVGGKGSAQRNNLAYELVATYAAFSSGPGISFEVYLPVASVLTVRRRPHDHDKHGDRSHTVRQADKFYTSREQSSCESSSAIKTTCLDFDDSIIRFLNTSWLCWYVILVMATGTYLPGNKCIFNTNIVARWVPFDHTLGLR